MDLLTPARKWAIAEPAEDLDTSMQADAPHDHRMPLAQQITMFLSVVGPIAGVVVSIVLLWNRGWGGVGWSGLFSMLAMYALTGYGVTIGFHRHLTHKAFETYGPIRLLLAICGCAAGQGAVIRWTATHRRHHQTSDHEGDPHSPHLFGDRAIDVLKGMWHAHIGWLFHRDPLDTADSVKDLTSDPAMLLIDKLYFFWVFLGILLPGAVVGLWTNSWQGFVSGCIWGGVARIGLMQHVTWSINSVCHVWGGREFQTRDHSVNNWICAVLALGEGWHNNHHAFPTSARQGLRWWQFDSSWLIILAMSGLGLVWNVRVPGESALRAKKIV